MTLEEFMIYYTDCYDVIDYKRVFNKDKMVKTYEEYVRDSEFDGLFVDDKVYYNKMYYDKHLVFNVYFFI